MQSLIEFAAAELKKSKFTIAFTGAGISVESGIPPFRGEHGLWNKYNPEVLDLGYYLENQEKCWYYIREIFYDFFADAQANGAHRVLARMEEKGLLQSIVTQNIDNLHLRAGNSPERTFQIHGNIFFMRCAEECRETPPRLIVPPSGTMTVGRSFRRSRKPSIESQNFPR